MVAFLHTVENSTAFTFIGRYTLNKFDREVKQKKMKGGSIRLKKNYIHNKPIALLRRDTSVFRFE